MLHGLQDNMKTLSLSICGKQLKNVLKMEQQSKLLIKGYSTMRIWTLLWLTLLKISNQKPTLQKFCERIKSEISSTVNLIGSIRTWNKSSYMSWEKEIIKIINQSKYRYSKIITAFSGVYGACHHNLRFHTFTHNWRSSNDKIVQIFVCF